MKKWKNRNYEKWNETRTRKNLKAFGIYILKASSKRKTEKKSWNITYKLNWASNSKTLTPTCAREMEKREVSIYTKKKVGKCRAMKQRVTKEQE